MRGPRLGVAILGVVCAGLFSGEAAGITTTPSPTPTPTWTSTHSFTPTMTPTGTPKPTPWLSAGAEIAVNATTSGDQRAPVVGRGADYGFVTAWVSNGQDGDGAGISARRFDRAGAPIGSEFPVNTVTTGDQDEPAIASGYDGTFVIAWSSGPAGARDVRAQRFGDDGNPIGGEFLVNTYTTGDQHSPSVGKGSDGFVVVWTSDGQDGDAGGVFGQKYSVNSIPDGAEFRVNETTTGDQRAPRVSGGWGNFVVVWESEGQDGDQGGIFARRYFPDETSEFQVNDIIAGPQTQPDVLNFGSILFVWSSPDGSGDGVFARGFNPGIPAPNPIGPQFRVSTRTVGNQSNPRVAVQDAWVPNPGFVVVWQSEGQDEPPDPGTGVFAQRFDNAPSSTAQFFLLQQPPRRGAEYRVNTYVAGDQSHPAVASLGDLGFVVAWDSAGQDGSGAGVVARKFNAPIAGYMDVDKTPSGGSSNRNGVLESGERVRISPAWTLPPFGSSPSLPSLPLWGSISNSKVQSGLPPTIDDALGDYGTISNYLQPCQINCYEVSVNGPRTVVHWDATFDESLGSTDPIGPMKKTWSLHIGNSFNDVPQDVFYPYIENIFHNGITGGGGCGIGAFCGDDGVLRQQMAVFLVKATRGATYVPPPATGSVFADVPAGDPFAPWIEDLARAGITGGCSAPPPPGLPNYCPTAIVNRQQMAAFLVNAYWPPQYGPAYCTGLFDDVPCSNPFAPYIERLSTTHVTGGCSANPPLYCPTEPTKRKQMATFLVKTFHLQLYGSD